MPAVDDLRCPRCGRRARALDLTATSITCADCDPAWDAVRHGKHPEFATGPDDLAGDPEAEDEEAPPTTAG